MQKTVENSIKSVGVKSDSILCIKHLELVFKFHNRLGGAKSAGGKKYIDTLIFNEAEEKNAIL